MFLLVNLFLPRFQLSPPGMQKRPVLGESSSLRGDPAPLAGVAVIKQLTGKFVVQVGNIGY
jgi:hypothetical protein